MSYKVKLNDEEQGVLNRILKLIDSSNANINVLAKYIDLASPSVISDWRSGKSKSFTKYIAKIADFYNVPITAIYGDMKVNIIVPNCPELNVMADESKVQEDKPMIELTNEEENLIEIFRSLGFEGRSMVISKAIEEKRNQQEAEQTKENVG